MAKGRMWIWEGRGRYDEEEDGSLVVVVVEEGESVGEE